MSHLDAIHQLRKHVSQHIIGQKMLVDRLLIALLADGHLLVEGAPGLAKTRAIKVLSSGIEGDFHRIQFTPDLVPADLTGTEIFRPQDGSFLFQKGPLFHNLILADEVNRAPAKVQSALLEAMAERQITVGPKTYKLPNLFLVMATQNPIEQEGTYPLPEAQLDRFLMKVHIDYPDVIAEKEILELTHREALDELREPTLPETLITQENLFPARKEVLNIHMTKNLRDYIVQLILATRNPAVYSETLASHIQYGGSTRATMALDRCSRAHAWLEGRDYVTPLDIQTMVYDVLRHRIIISYQAEANGITTDDVIKELISLIAVP